MARCDQTTESTRASRSIINPGIDGVVVKTFAQHGKNLTYSGEQVDQAVQLGVGTLVRDVDARLNVGDIDARGRDLRPKPEDRNDHQDEQQLPPQVRGPESVRERAQHEILFLQA